MHNLRHFMASAFRFSPRLVGHKTDLIIVMNEVLFDFAVAKSKAKADADTTESLLIVLNIGVEIRAIILGRILGEISVRLVGLRHRLRSDRRVTPRRAHWPSQARGYLLPSNWLDR